VAVHPSTFAVTTVPSSPPTRSGTGVASNGPPAAISSRAHHGRTPTSSPSAPASATSCSASSV
jgi:hypothetical protein